MKKYLITGFLALGLISCAQKKLAEQEQIATAVQGPGQGLVSPAKDLYSDGRSKMVKTADCRFQVKDLKKSKESMAASIKKYSGFIENSNLEFQNPMLEEHLTIRVLSENFEDLLNDVMHEASYVNAQKVTSDDVSKEFVDLESRLKTKREVQQRYEEILRKKAGTLEELLATEKQIGELQEEIEATVSQISFLKEKVRYSTIKLEIYQIVEQQVADVEPGSSWRDRFSEAFMSGLTHLTDFLVGVVYLWPFVLMGAGGYLIWMRRRKRIVKVV